MNKLEKSIIAIMLVITLTMTNFAILSMQIISYALDVINSTNEDNVQFTAYFKDASGNKVASKEEIINQTDMKLYVEISVKKEGYFNGAIELTDSNFKLKEQTYTTDVNKVEGNKITLNQINAGSTVSLELDIEPTYEESYDISNLDKISKIKISGIYRDSEEIDKKIEATREVNLKLISPYSNSEETAYLTSEMITNKIYQITNAENIAENKKIVQYKITSGLNEALYPIKTTTLNIPVPENMQSYEVIKRGLYATNGDTNNTNIEDGIAYNEEENLLSITINNQANTENKISWNKNYKDTLIVTFIVAETEEIKESEITSTIELYDGVKLNGQAQTIVEEKDGIINYEINAETEIYKGNLYANIEKEIQTSSIIDIRYKNIANNIRIIEGEANYQTTTENIVTEKQANLTYRTSSIVKEDLVSVLGESGTLKIIDSLGNVTTINSQSEANEEGIVEINYPDGINSITIEIANAENTGVIKVNHKRVLTKGEYTKDEIRSFENINLKGTLSADKNVENKNVNTNIKLQETVTEASVYINKESLSTIQTNESVEILVLLKSDNEKYDLYKNPTVILELPVEVSSIDIKEAKIILAHEGFKGKLDYVKNENGNSVLKFELTGEQLSYANIAQEGIGIKIKADITLKKDTPTKDVLIKMNYTNENGIEESYYTEKSIKAESQYGMLTYTKISNYNMAGNTEENVNENEVAVKIDAGAQTRSANIAYALVNNFGQELNQVEVIGKLAVENEDYNTFTTILNSLNVNKENVKILYTKDILNAEEINWQEQVDNINEVKGYKVIISSISAGEVVYINANIQLPEGINYGEYAEIQNTVNYIYQGQEKTKTSPIILATESLIMTLEDGTTIDAETPTVYTSNNGITVATVARTEAEILEDGSFATKELKAEETVREGQVITYISTITNNSGIDRSNVTVDVTQTNGSIYGLVGKVDVNGMNYTEYGNVGNTSTIATIDNLAAGETKTVEWYVIVSENANENDEVYGTIKIGLSGQVFATAYTRRNVIKQEEIAIYMKYIMNEESLIEATKIVPLAIDVKNLTENEKQNVEVTVYTKGLKELDNEFSTYNSENVSIKEVGENYLKIKIDKLEGNSTKEIYFIPIATDMDISKESDEIYCFAVCEINNLEYTSNLFKRNIFQNKANITTNITSSASESEKVLNKEHIDFNIKVENESLSVAGNLYYSIKFTKGVQVKDVILIKNNEEINISENIYNNEITFNLELGATETAEINIKVYIDYGEIYSSKIEAVFELNNEEIKSYEFTLDTLDSEHLDFDNDTGIIESDEESDNIEDEIWIDDTIKEEYEEDIINDDEDNDFNEDIDNEDGGNQDGGNEDDGNEDDGNQDDGNQGDENEDGGNEDDGSEDGGNQENEMKISGIAWIDENRDGKRDTTEKVLGGLTIYVLDEEKNEYVKNSDGSILKTTTNEKGEYSISLGKGKYIVIVIYDSNKYSLTDYKKTNIESNENSDVTSKPITIDGETLNAGVTESITLSTQDITNIDIGLIENKTFDLELEKYINRVVVQNSQGTKTYDYKKEKNTKIEIHSKYINGSTVLIEYGILIKNTGDISGFVNTVIDYLPEGLVFSSELNKDWYKADSYLYTTILQDKEIMPGEEVELKLILTKTMNTNNVGLVVNSAEIYLDSNEYGLSDIDSSAGNKSSTEDDYSSAEVIIGISTGDTVEYIAIIIMICLTIAVAGIVVYEILKERR